jgi:hypothetical protein
LRPSLPVLLSATIAAAGVGGLVLVAEATQAGSAPGNGEKTFDAPGCQPNEYDGPGSKPHYLSHRNCPNPTPVVVAHTSYRDGAWRVTWDGTRSFDPVGGRLVRYEWSVGPGPRRIGSYITVAYRRPGSHAVALYVTDDSGATGTTLGTVNLK